MGWARLSLQGGSTRESLIRERPTRHVAQASATPLAVEEDSAVGAPGAPTRCTCTPTAASWVSEDSDITHPSVPAFDGIAVNSPLGAISRQYTTNMLH
jgi:hypothetical protein